MWEQKDKQFFRQGDAMCLGSVIVVGENVFVVGKSAMIVIHDRDPRKDVLVYRRKACSWVGAGP